MLILQIILGLASRVSHYQQAITLLESQDQNTDELLHQLQLAYRLEKSIAALEFLGEFYLYGRPFLDYVDVKPIQTDTKKALGYLYKAYKLGSKSAMLHLQLILKQTELFPSLIESNLEQYIQQLKNTEQAKQSYGFQVSRANAYSSCSSNILVNSTHHYVLSPFTNLDQCASQCEDIAQRLQAPTREANAFISKNGGYLRTIGRIDKALENHKASSKNAQILASLRAQSSTEQAILANNYILGNPDAGIKQDVQTAIDYFEKAAAQGQVNALENLGIVYSRGIGRPQNFTKAIEYLEQAAQKGSVSAKNSLAILYMDGQGVEQDKQKSIELLTNSAQQGDLQSFSNLGIAYAKGDGVKQDTSKALKLLTQSYVAGSISSAFNLGNIYLTGQYGVQKNCNAAIKYFTEVIIKGEIVIAQQQAFQAYLEGNIKEAYLLYAAGADLGLVDCMMSAAWILENHPDLFPENTEKAIYQFYLMAATLNNSEAQLKLGKIELQAGNYVKAKFMFSITSSHSESLYYQGYMAEHGLGQKQNFKKAFEQYKKLITRQEIFLGVTSIMKATISQVLSYF